MLHDGSLNKASKPLYGQVAIIGGGLIGSSIARGARRHGLATDVVIHDRSPAARESITALGLADVVTEDIGEAVARADLVIIAVPVLSFGEVAATIAPHLKPGSTVSDVGSVKASVMSTLLSALPETVFVIPAHPIAGTEKSGPEAGFAALFENRWSIITPPPRQDPPFLEALEKLAAFWTGLGSKVEIMDPGHHDLVLAVTSHLPHLISYNIVGMAVDLEKVTRSEIMAYSAGGFREFTRLASSNPVMWRDICLANKAAILDIVGRFIEDLHGLSRALRWDDGDKLLEMFQKSAEMAECVRGLGGPAAQVEQETTG